MSSANPCIFSGICLPVLSSFLKSFSVFKKCQLWTVKYLLNWVCKMQLFNMNNKTHRGNLIHVSQLTPWIPVIIFTVRNHVTDIFFSLYFKISDTMINLQASCNFSTTKFLIIRGDTIHCNSRVLRGRGIYIYGQFPLNMTHIQLNVTTYAQLRETKLCVKSLLWSSYKWWMSVQVHCYYHGHIVGVEDSSASVGLCSGIKWVILWM